MKAVIYKALGKIRRTIWSFIVAYMIGMHNFYHGDDKTADNMAIKNEVTESQENGTPND